MQLEKATIQEIINWRQKNRVLPSEILEYFIKRIEKHNEKLNALVYRRFETARKIAKEQDSIPFENLPLMAGIPFTTKEMIQVEGAPYTIGLKKRRGEISSRSASVVQRLESLGAICIGVTNIPELGFWWETDNLVYGKTSNPHDFKRTPGGSSGGEAAMISAGLVPFGIGSDIGGSIRIPASFCGITGLKPTRKVISLVGHFPLTVESVEKSVSSDYMLTTVGPMAKSAEDLIFLTKILAGEDGLDRELFQAALDFTPRSFKGKKVYYLDNPEISLAMKSSSEVRLATLSAVSAFVDAGAEICELPTDIFKQAFNLWRTAVGECSAPSFTSKLGNGDELSLRKEFAKMMTLRPEITFVDLVYATIEKLSSKEKNLEKISELHSLSKELNELLGDSNILVFPTHPTVAPYHHVPKTRPFNFLYTAIFNALDLPSVSVPVSRNKDGLPIGVQIVAGKFQDPVALYGGLHLESVFGRNFLPEKYFKKNQTNRISVQPSFPSGTV